MSLLRTEEETEEYVDGKKEEQEQEETKNLIHLICGIRPKQKQWYHSILFLFLAFYCFISIFSSDDGPSSTNGCSFSPLYGS